MKLRNIKAIVCLFAALPVTQAQTNVPAQPTTQPTTSPTPTTGTPTAAPPVATTTPSNGFNTARDPGVRSGSPGAGNPLPGLSSAEMQMFLAGSAKFQQVDSVTGAFGGTDVGLGPGFNLDSCGGCHAFPAVGGSSPKVNPQVGVASKNGARNTIPSFITANGPVREVRFKTKPDGTPDGGVHDLFTITGRTDAAGCTAAQPDFATAVRQGNAIFRIPTPTFGLGLIEAIPDSAIIANVAQTQARRQQSQVSGEPNMSGNDGTVMRFGWKAQNKSLMVFAGEAYNVEQGVTNEIFPQERNTSNDSCLYNKLPESAANPNGGSAVGGQSDVELFAAFMHFLAPPAPVTPASPGGAALFDSIGCTLCHTPSMKTSPNISPALSNQTVNLYSDLLVHNMGTNLADGITQGAAGGNEFRTAPLWGLGQRIFLLHDGRSTDLVDAIRQHSSAGSEANQVVNNYNNLPARQQQAILDFLRSL